MNAASSGKSTTDRLFDAIDKLGDNVGKMYQDVAILIDDRNRASAQRQRTYEKIEGIERRTDNVERGLAANTTLCAQIQTDMIAVQRDVADYKVDKRLVAPALKRIDDLNPAARPDGHRGRAPSRHVGRLQWA